MPRMGDSSVIEAQAFGMGRLDAGFAPRAEEQFQSLVPERADHTGICIASLYELAINRMAYPGWDRKRRWFSTLRSSGANGAATQSRSCHGRAELFLPQRRCRNSWFVRCTIATPTLPPGFLSVDCPRSTMPIVLGNTFSPLRRPRFDCPDRAADGRVAR